MNSGSVIEDSMSPSKARKDIGDAHRKDRQRRNRILEGYEGRGQDFGAGNDTRDMEEEEAEKEAELTKRAKESMVFKDEQPDEKVS